MRTDARVTVEGDAPVAYPLSAPFGPPRRYPEFSDRLPQGELAPNDLYESIRTLFLQANLNAEHRGTSAWSPLSAVISPGDTVVLKPNWVRHFNPSTAGTLASVITHSAVIRAVCDYALLAAGPNGRIIIADAPQQDCDFERLREFADLDRLLAHYRQLRLAVEIRDLRCEAVRFEAGVITERRALPGDPAGYTEVDLGEASAFTRSNLKASRLRGADYDESETVQHHMGGAHRYLVSNTILHADCVINLPKLKTHKKAGITCSLKNLVGINGNKNYLPHHTSGFPGHGGDEFAARNPYTIARRLAVEWARRRLTLGKTTNLIKTLRRVEARTHPEEIIKAGNWYGNDTIWRTIVDLNTILRYADREGNLGPLPFSGRKQFHLVDGVVVGGGSGPLAPEDNPAGILICGFDPVRVDATAAALTGLAWRKIPSVREAFNDRAYPLTVAEPLASPFISLRRQGETLIYDLDGCPTLVPITPHFGWRGHIEKARETESEYAASATG